MYGARRSGIIHDATYGAAPARQRVTSAQRSANLAHVFACWLRVEVSDCALFVAAIGRRAIAALRTDRRFRAAGDLYVSAYACLAVCLASVRMRSDAGPSPEGVRDR